MHGALMTLICILRPIASAAFSPAPMMSALIFYVALTCQAAPERRQENGFDYGISAGARSYPVGAAAAFIGGYNIHLWTLNGASADEVVSTGNADTPVDAAADSESKNWQIGYLRPNLRLQSSGVVNSATMDLEFFPVKILGIAVGQNLSGRNLKPADFDCLDIHCGGRLSRQYYRAQAALGFDKYFFLYKYRVEQIDSNYSDRDFLEETSNLVGEKNGDRLSTQEFILGYTISDHWKSALISSHQKFKVTGHSNRFMYLGAGYSWQKWQVFAGAGQYQSTHQSQRMSAFASLTWTGAKSMGLF